MHPFFSEQLRSRRDVLRLAAAAAVVGSGATKVFAQTSPGDIPALMPRDNQGHQFLFYSDCCSGVPGATNESKHASVNAMANRIRPRPEFIAFPGDAIMGYVEDQDALRTQWNYWLHTEMKWCQSLGIPLYQSTSNHHTYDFGSETVFREVHPNLPQNGPAKYRGLEYFLRRGNLLYVSMHQPDRLKPYRSDMVFDPRWLDKVLSQNADAKYKLVAGHYPCFPVNGYGQYPGWCFRPEERQPFWDVLVRHQVDAYLASHILAFDVQAHDGVLQILSGGAGTWDGGPLPLMPSRSEYLHAVQMALDGQGLRYQVLDKKGQRRERLNWPFTLPDSPGWAAVTTDNVGDLAKQQITESIVAWRCAGRLTDYNVGSPAQTMLCAYGNLEAATTIWIGVDGFPPRLTVQLIPEAGYGVQNWRGPAIKKDQPFDFQIALHAGMGPGGVLYRTRDSAPWTSLSSTSSKGAEDLSWPKHWRFGTGESGATDRPFRNPELKITYVRRPIAT